MNRRVFELMYQQQGHVHQAIALKYHSVRHGGVNFRVPLDQSTLRLNFLSKNCLAFDT
jgi:hypothetical protein